MAPFRTYVRLTMNELTPYQSEIARAVLDSVLHERRLTFTVEIARGGGAREISAQLEMLLLSLHVNDGVRLLRVAPAEGMEPSSRLRGYLERSSLQGLWSAEMGTVRLGRSIVRYVTPEELGPTLVTPRTQAAGLIEVAAAQLVEPATYDRWLVPLAEATGATTVLYGAPLNGESRFEEIKQRNRELEASDGIRRHFRVTWEQAAEALPGYRDRMTEARSRLGEEHPEFQTAYLLRPVAASGPFLSAPRQRLAEGDRRHREPSVGDRYAASIVVTRLPALDTTSVPRLLASPGATAVVTISRRLSEASGESAEVIEHRWLEAVDAATLAKRAAKVVGEWRCERVVVEQRAGEGGGPAAFRSLLERGIEPTPVEWASADDAQDSRLAMDLLAAIHTDGVQLYPMDGSPERRTLRHEVESAVATYGTDGLLRLRLPEIDEGFLRGLLLLVRTLTPATRQPAEATETALAS